MAKKKATRKKATKKKAAPTPSGASPAAAPTAQTAAAMPAMQTIPGMQAVPGMPGMMPGAAALGTAQPGMPAGTAQANPMLGMLQMMQMMMGSGAGPTLVDPAAIPFGVSQLNDDNDAGLDAAIIRPALFETLIKHQEPLPLGSVLDSLCLTDDGQHPLGGVPKGCTIAFAGPPGKGKTRTALAGLAQVALQGERVAFVVAEEGFHDAEGYGRDDLCSRMVKVGMAVTGLDEDVFRQEVLENVYVLESQYHKGQSWDDFVGKYRYLVEQEEIGFVVIDSLNMLDPTRNRTADNLSALKTYNHEQGATCICIGQIRDTGAPVGGEALQHTADVVFLIEEMSLGSKEIAELWGGKYRDRIDIIRAVKSVTTPIFPHPIRLGRDPDSGILVVHESQPELYAVPAMS